MRKSIFLLVLVLIINSLYAGVKVEVRKIIKKEVSKNIVFDGYFSMEKTLNIFPKIRGILVKVYKKENEPVKKGEIIALIKRDDPGYKFKPLKVFAPDTGVIIKISSYEGVRVNPQSPIMTIGSYNPIIFSANIPINLFNKIKKGDRAKIKISGIDKLYSGIVYTKLNPADFKTKTAIIKIKVKNPDYKIVPNLFGEAEILKEKKDEILLAPADGVFVSESKYFVWLVKDGKAYKKEVKIGELYGKYFEIKNGLIEGDTIIVFGAENLKNGDKVVF